MSPVKFYLLGGVIITLLLLVSRQWGAATAGIVVTIGLLFTHTRKPHTHKRATAPVTAAQRNPSATLYVMDGCPYAQTAAAALESANVPFVVQTVAPSREDPQRKKLAAASGVLTTPVMKTADGSFIGGSNGIVDWAHTK